MTFEQPSYNQTSINLRYTSSLNNSEEGIIGENVTRTCLKATALRLSKGYTLWYGNVFSLAMTAVIPFLLLLWLNCKIYSTFQSAFNERHSLTEEAEMIELKGQMQRQFSERKVQEYRITMVLFAIVIAFVSCHSLKAILNIEEIAEYDDLNKTLEEAEKHGVYCTGVQFWVIITNHISHILLQVNSSINIVIYCFLNSKFMQALRSKLPQCIQTCPRSHHKKTIARSKTISTKI